MTALAAAGAFCLGLILGATIVVVAVRRRDATQSPTADRLDDADRRAVAAEFSIHASAVQQGLSEFADALADGDQVLRARLRRFERAGRR